MSITAPEFEVNLGDDVVIEIPIEARDGTPIGEDILAGASALFGYGPTPEAAMRENADRPSARPTIGSITYRGGPFPAVVVPLLAAETGALPSGAVFHWACRLLVGGSPKVISRGTFRTCPVPI